MATLNEFVSSVMERDDFCILTHQRPDGDALGSASALCSALRRMGKRAVVYPNPEITATFAEFCSPYVGESGDDACYIAVDLAEEKLFPKGFTGRVAFCADHHPTNSGYAELTLLEPGKASCGEIILDIIELMCGNVTKEEANLLYVAVSTDCGCFCYANTSPDTLRAAAHLLELGAENGRLNKRLFRSMSLARLKLEGLIFSTLRSYRNNQIVIAVVTQAMMEEAGATEDDCDDLASLPGKVRGSVVSITVRELSPGRSKASVRTNELVDASAVCARFGGGGHRMASGCNYDLPPEEFAGLLLQAVNEIWK